MCSVEMERLHQKFERQGISPEEFAYSIHKLWLRSKSSPTTNLLHTGSTGKKYLTKAWIEANLPLVEEFQQAWQEFFQVQDRLGHHPVAYSGEKELVKFYRRLPKSERLFTVTGDTSIEPQRCLEGLLSEESHPSGHLERVLNPKRDFRSGRLLPDTDFQEFKIFHGALVIPIHSDEDVVDHLKSCISVLQKLTKEAERIEWQIAVEQEDWGEGPEEG